jgi:cytoskeleton protein RodZ
VPTGAMVLLGVVLVLVSYGLWFRHTAHERMLAAAVPSVPAELAPLAMPKIVSPAAPAATVAAPATAPTAKTAAAAPAPAATAPASGTPAPGTQAAALPAPPSAAPATKTPATTASPAPPAPEAGRTILATADSWVEVRDPTGNILFSRVLHAGESWPVPDMAGLTMTAGNAGATEIADGGKTSPPLGAAGAVVRGYALTPAAAAQPLTTGH